jgi:3',5'-cyclic AMP phosphodiesterase CpdA
MGNDPVRVVAVGDIAASDNADAAVAARVAALKPARLLLVGDIAYPTGSTADFASYFNPDWGRFSGIWLPVPGNHEYKTAGAAGYRAYFSETGGLYWSKKVGDWLIIGLDSEQPKSSAQLKWLSKTLKRNQGTPTLVAAHTPRYSSGMHGDQSKEAPLWNAIRKDEDVKLVVWGHDHDYERMTIPVAGRSEPLQAFIVGTGGGELRDTPSLPRRSWRDVYLDHIYGALALNLGEAGFSWEFVQDSGQVLDSGATQF